MLPLRLAGASRRRSPAAAVAALALLLPAAASAAPALLAAPYDEAGYWAFADRMQERLDATWDQRAGYYRLGRGGGEPMANAMLLLTHAVAD